MIFSSLFQILISLAGGMAAGLQAPFTGLMGQKVGELGSVLITYGGGAILITLIVLVTGQHQLGAWRTIPWYAFLAGPLGLIIIGALSYTTPRLGSAAAATLFIVSWLIFGAITDHFGWFGADIRPLNSTRLLGLGALLFGTWVVVR